MVRVLKTLRKVKSLAHALLSEKNRMLMKFERQNVIETTSSSSDSEDNAYDPVRMMEVKDPYVRLRASGRIKKMMKEFGNRNLEITDVNMIRAMFKHQIKDFKE